MVLYFLATPRYFARLSYEILREARPRGVALIDVFRCMKRERVCEREREGRRVAW